MAANGSMVSLIFGAPAHWLGSVLSANLSQEPNIRSQRVCSGLLLKALQGPRVLAESKLNGVWLR